MFPMSIVPIGHLDLTKDDTHFMALLHLVQTSLEYQDFFRARVEEGKFVLLDDSAVERPGIDPLEIIEGAKAIGASEVMLADSLYDEKATLSKARTTLDAIIFEFGDDLPFTVMAVPQGRTPAEWLRCAKAMASWSDVDTIGISYTTTTYFKSGCRAEAIQALLSNGVVSKAIHLLGCFDIEEARATVRQYPGIRSIDSAIATVFTQKGAFIGDGYQRSQDLRARTIDFKKCLLPPRSLARNLQLWRHLILEMEQ